MGREAARKTWMRVLNKDDVARLSELLSAKRRQWSEWECKLPRGNIIVYVPIVPWDSKTRKPDPSRRYMAKHWRVVPEPARPFQLEYVRHTGRWRPVFEAVGDLDRIADFIEKDARGLSYIASTED